MPPNSNIQKMVDTLIQNNEIVVFSKSWCGYCARAKRTLTSTGKQLEVLELDQVNDGRAIQQYLHQKTGQFTVPSVWIKGQFQGGNDEVQSLDRRGQLMKLFKTSA